MIRKIYLNPETGSVAPLGIGIFTITISMILAVTASVSLFIFQKRLTNFSESAALFVSSGSGSSTDFAQVVGIADFKDFNIRDELLLDYKTTYVKTCANWVSPVTSFVSKSGITVCSHASARSE